MRAYGFDSDERVKSLIDKILALSGLEFAQPFAVCYQGRQIVSGNN